VAYYVHIMASAPRGTLYIGVTNDLVRRVHEHREGTVPGFTTRYGVKRLVHFEALDDAISAISREKLLKRWNRAWKIDLVERSNPRWDDLFDSIAS
jgi:putative endonuclease